MSDRQELLRYFSTKEIGQIHRHGYSDQQILKAVSDLVEDGTATEGTAHDVFFELMPELLEEPPTKESFGRNGAEYGGNLVIDYLWKPYILYNEFQDIFGKSGTGKTFLLSLICASVTTGNFPTAKRDPGTVLYISGEESFDEVADRIARAGGNLNRVTIIDRSESVGLNFDDRYDDFSAVVRRYRPDLLVCDPWQCFCGERIDLNRQNQTRPLLQKVSLLAKENHTAVVFIAHMNKSQFMADANDGLSGSSEIVNAARSAIRVIEDETDPDRRIAIHTKSNRAKRGQSLRFRFIGERIAWDGFSEITKETLEQASRTRKTPLEALQQSTVTEEEHKELITALLEESKNTELCGVRITYDEFRMKYGDSVFSGRQPKRVLDEVIPEMQARDIVLKTGIEIRRGNKHPYGFYIQRIADIDSEK